MSKHGSSWAGISLGNSRGIKFDRGLLENLLLPQCGHLGARSEKPAWQTVQYFVFTATDVSTTLVTSLFAFSCMLILLQKIGTKKDREKRV